MQPAELDSPVATNGTGWFYVHQDGHTRDAVTIAELQQAILGGTIRGDSLTCEAGETEWQPISAHPLLASHLSPLFARMRRLAELQAALEEVGAAINQNRDGVSNRLSSIQVFYRSGSDIIENPPPRGPVFFEKTTDTLGPATLWVVLDLIDAGTLPVYTQACRKGTDFWTDALQMSQTLLGLPKHRA
jgi:hypothetical protein